jgi:hypothetical protein
MAAIDQLARDVGEINGKLDTLLKFYEDDRRRLTAVEKKVWWGSGVAAGIGLLAGPLLKKMGIAT